MAVAGCTKETKSSRIKVAENGRKAVCVNPSPGKVVYHITRVDDCVVKEGPRTDYLVSEGEDVSVLVELKGSDVGRACEQLFASAEHPEVRKELKSSPGFLVICSKYPRFDTFVARAKTKAARVYGTGFYVVTKEGVFDIRRVVAIDGPQ